MQRSLFLLALLSGAFAVACGDDTSPPPIDGDGGVVDTTDSDGDGIRNEDEGIRTDVDTDMDGQPDWMDLDSDNDGIPDAMEAGDADPASPPADSDSDTIPDFRDTDSDDNGIPDAAEGTGDADGDGRPDYADLDDDDDFVSDALELSDGAFPRDGDEDGLPDFRDPDRDNDYILDGHEHGWGDTDGDGTPDIDDDDSDNDGVPDSVEAGDMDIRTPPVDSDEDGTEDYRDPDSDNDGLADGDEVAAGSDPTRADTDEDGVSDLIEAAAGTDPTDRFDNPLARGDFVFVVPYMEAPSPPRDTLNFETSLQFADIYFGFDVTGSMTAELAAVGDPVTGVPAIIDQLRCAESGVTCTAGSMCGADEVCNAAGRCAADPRVSTCIPDIWTGVGYFEDVDEFQNVQSLQPDPAVTAAAIPGTMGGGSEAVFQAPACVADRANCPSAACAPAGSGIGCPGFRAEAVRIYIQITDAEDDCLGSCSRWTAAFAGSELMRQNIKFMSLYNEDDPGNSRPNGAQLDAEAIAVASGTLDPMGQPYVYRALDAAVVDQTVQAVRNLVNADNFRMTIDAADEPLDDGDALQFIDYLEVNRSGGLCTMVPDVEDSDGDGHDDVFSSLRPGVPVCWDVVPKQNDTVMPDIRPLVFRAKLTVRADGSAVDDRIVFFLIPPMIPDPGGPD